MITAGMVQEVQCHHHLMYILQSHLKLFCHKFKSFSLACQMFFGKKNINYQKNSKVHSVYAAPSCSLKVSDPQLLMIFHHLSRVGRVCVVNKSVKATWDASTISHLNNMILVCFWPVGPHGEEVWAPLLKRE